MRHAIQRILFATLTVAGWFAALWLIVVRDVGSSGFSSVQGLSAACLFISVPFVTFIAIAQRWNVPFLEFEAMFGWGGAALVLSFVAPRPNPPIWQVLLALVPLTVAIASAAMVLFHLGALRLAAGQRVVSFVDSRRRGYLAATSIVLLALLAGADAFSPMIALLLLGMCILIEYLVAANRRRSGSTSIRSIPEY